MGYGYKKTSLEIVYENLANSGICRELHDKYIVTLQTPKVSLNAIRVYDDGSVVDTFKIKSEGYNDFPSRTYYLNEVAGYQWADPLIDLVKFRKVPTYNVSPDTVRTGKNSISSFENWYWDKLQRETSRLIVDFKMICEEQEKAIQQTAEYKALRQEKVTEFLIKKFKDLTKNFKLEKEGMRDLMYKAVDELLVEDVMDK